MNGRGSRRGGRLLIICVVVSLGLPLGRGVVTASEHVPGTPTGGELVEVPCPFAVEVIPFDVDCGLLVVPEDQLDPAAGTIALSVATVRSPDRAPDAEPVLYLEGGPGVGAFGAVAPLLNTDVGAALVGERDLIVLDQRGTGYSVLRLDCTLFSPDRLADPDRFVAAATSCFERFSSAGIALGSYTTGDVAADAMDLRVAMGLDRWNVYGVSYGTTVALELLRRDPSGTRAVTLDSPSPPQSNEILDDVRYKAEALGRVFAGCAAQPDCAAAHPDLAARFDAAIAALNAAPLDLGGFAVTGDLLVFVLTNTAFFTVDLIPELPGLIDGALRGDVEPLAELFGGLGATGDGSGLETESFVASDGLFLAVTCAEEAPRTRRSDLDSLAAGGAVAASLARSAAAVIAGCGAWERPPAARPEPTAVTSDAPVLILVGEWDPSTPPALAAATAATLPNARTVILPGQGHGVVGSAATTCVLDIMSAFWTDPALDPDRSCVERDYASISFGARTAG